MKSRDSTGESIIHKHEHHSLQRKPKQIVLPNVKDEPRPWLAWLVLLGAQGMTAKVVGSSAWLGLLGFGVIGFIFLKNLQHALGRLTLRNCDFLGYDSANFFTASAFGRSTENPYLDLPRKSGSRFRVA